MHTLRRKSPLYPVALAITLLIAARAHAQLCPALADHARATSVTERTAIDSSLAPASERSQALPLTALEQKTRAAGDFASAQSPTVLAEAQFTNAVMHTVSAQRESQAASHPRDNIVHALLLAGFQPGLSEANLQPMFAD
jgi:hypothetical protein